MGSLLLLPMCPSGPREAQAVSRREPHHCRAKSLCLWGGCALLLVLVAAFVLGVLAVHPATSCYEAFGGAGC